MAAALALLLLEPAFRAEDRVSSLGRYSGYSHPEYNGWTKQSQYVAMRDGTRLAVDIYRPTWWWIPARERLPVLWSHIRYHRALLQGGETRDPVQDSPRYQKLLSYGYVLAFADARGTGSSFGSRDGPFSRAERNDAYDLTEWLARQPWSDDSIGMFGTSYMGITQYFAASASPPSLKAVFPEKAMFDLYDFAYPGGILRDDFGRQWSDLVERLDTVSPSPPVDEDSGQLLLSAARGEHSRNRTVFELLAPLPYRDSVDPRSGEQVYRTRSPSSYLAEINGSGTPIYHLSGWLDMWPRDALLWFANLKVPQKIVIGPWSHIGTEDFDNFAEHLRWYDYWLKGIDNGIMSEPPVHYFTIGAPAGEEWQIADAWPLPKERRVNLYFCTLLEAPRTARSERGLCRDPQDESGADLFDVNLAATTGRNTRWSNGYGWPIDYSNLSPQRGISYRTPPLERDIEVTGHPVLRLWLTSSSPDVDIVAYLEEVDPSGRIVYVTEGALRASHRALADPPDNRIGLPYHGSLAADVRRLTAAPAELVFDMHPISRIFGARSRIQITLAGADADNLIRHAPTEEPPRVRIFRGESYPSAIDLPEIPGRDPRPSHGASSN